MAWKDVGEDMGYREERHQAARRVLDRRLRKGTSLVLYLRLFGGVEVLQDTDAGAYLTENYLLDHLDRGIDLITVQQPGWAVSYDSMRTSGDLTRRAPALLIDDSQWFSVVQELIALADLIVSECSAATSSMAPLRDGVRAELKSCLEVKAQERTVLILPSRAASSARRWRTSTTTSWSRSSPDASTAPSSPLSRCSGRSSCGIFSTAPGGSRACPGGRRRP